MLHQQNNQNWRLFVQSSARVELQNHVIKKSRDSVKTVCVGHHVAKLRLLCCLTFLTYILFSSMVGVLARSFALCKVSSCTCDVMREWNWASSAVMLINTPQNLDKSASERSLTPVSKILWGKRDCAKTIIDHQNQKCITHFRQIWKKK